MYVLENNRLKVEVAAPGEVYRGPRFDWTGFVTQVTLDKRVTYCVPERLESEAGTGGIGLSNEFGIDTPLGYDEVEVGEQFPKIGVGLLTKKEDSAYDFFYKYDVTPIDVKVNKTGQTLTFDSATESLHGYGYRLLKKIALDHNKLTISYTLKNIGTLAFKTNEYSHNFIGINNQIVNENYQLTLPNMRHLDVTVGTIKKTNQQLTWPVRPKGDFYAHIDLDQSLTSEKYHWDLYHQTVRAGVRELNAFEPAKMALWGRAHVVSPEVFVNIDLAPGETQMWERCYQFYQKESSR
ncbi:hypothetical protein [Amphibacillus indicireducens]|uniref:Uncharacterized protein n=1 Tax=Amphibacillus indicireducens TaxID=1076330 RepID=A0ABP7VTW9_9BACI